MIALFAWFLTPIGSIVGVILAIAVTLGSIYWKITSDAVTAERARVEQGNTNEINKANKARDDVRSACDRTPADCLPESNFRD